MKAAVLFAKHEPFVIEEAEVPEAGPGEVLVRIATIGACHTDLGPVHGQVEVALPAIMGHELAGVIDSVGEDANRGFRKGDRVIIAHRYKCGLCFYCKCGRENICQNKPHPPPITLANGRKAYRWNVGGFAEMINVPEYMIERVPANITLEEACTLGCRVTTAYHAVKNGARLNPGDSAVVVGCGGLGLLTIQFLRAMGAHPIIAIDLIEKKLDVARKIGATHIVNAATSDTATEVKRITGIGADVSFQTAGSSKAVVPSIQSVRPGGTAVMVGVDRNPVEIYADTFVYNEITVTGVMSRKVSDVPKAISLVEAGKIDIKSLITASYKFEEINEAYSSVQKGEALLSIIRT